MNDITVLVAEDDSDARELARGYLTRWGYSVIEATNGTDALTAVQESGVSIVLLDWVMPGMEGIDVCDRLRKMPLDRYVYIIMVTGKSTKEDLINGLSRGADDYIAKPFDFQELKVRLRSAERVVKLEHRLKEAYDRLFEIATHDQLTGVFNRESILSRFTREARRGLRVGHEVGFIFCDIDHFKQVNDTYGHPVGDEVLREVADILQEVCRSYDLVGRYGGEEFVIVLPGLNTAATVSVAERIREALGKRPLHVGNMDVPVTMSFGAASTTSGTDVNAILKAADDALYRAKTGGRNRIERAPDAAVSFMDIEE